MGMNLRSEILNILIEAIREHKDMPEAHDALMEVFVRIKQIDCENKCIWFKGGNCSYFTNTGNPHHICERYEREIWDD